MHKLTDTQQAELDRLIKSSGEVRSCFHPALPFVRRDLHPTEDALSIDLDADLKRRLDKNQVEIKAAAPNKGLGLFARRKFRKGDVIWEEDPWLFGTVDENHCFYCARPLLSERSKTETNHEDKQKNVERRRIPCAHCNC